MNTDPNAPAFPRPFSIDSDGFEATAFYGLTIREYIATHIAAHPDTRATYEVIARYSVKAADALIAELNQEQS